MARVKAILFLEFGEKRAVFIRVKSGLTKKRVVWVIAALCVVILSVAATFWPGAQEPEYQGKKLSEWCDDIVHNTYSAPQAREAVSIIGEKSVPFFVQWIGSDRRLQRRWRLAGRLPSWARRTRPVMRWAAPWLSSRQIARGKVGFEIVATKAVSAITELRRIAEDPSPPTSNPYPACDCLSYIGQGGLTALVEIFSNSRNSPIQQSAALFAIQNVAYRGGDVGQAIPALIASVNGSETNGIASQARKTLEDWARDPAFNDKIDPNLPHIDVSSRILIIKSLEHMGTNDVPAHWASKVALQARDDSNEGVRSAASNTLNRIKVDWANKYDSAGSR